MLKGVISMPKQKRAIQTREDIIETAVKVFSEKDITIPVPMRSQK